MECLKHTDHRPYAHPASRPLWRQRWLDLAFFHWPIEAELLRSFMPDGLELDLYADDFSDGQAWLSVVPFRMEDVTLNGFPSLPVVSHFPELNLRTYVVKDSKPGVWFFSLDADQALAVWAAKRFFHLPYYKATMSCDKATMSCEYDEGEIQYRSSREIDGAGFAASYRADGEKYHAEPGSLEHWLTERYCLYTVDDRGQLYRGEIHHQPWSLQACKYLIRTNELGEKDGLPINCEPSLAQYSQQLDVAIWGLDRC